MDATMSLRASKDGHTPRHDDTTSIDGSNDEHRSIKDGRGSYERVDARDDDTMSVEASNDGWQRGASDEG